MPSVSRAVDSLTSAVLSGLRMRTGLVHLEFRLAPEGPTLMEVAVRMPGDYLMDLLGLTHGVDWFELAVRAAMGLELPQQPAEPVRYAASYLPVSPPGVVTEIAGLDEIRAHPCVVQLRARSSRSATRSRRCGRRRSASATSCWRRTRRTELEEALEYVRETFVVRTAPDRAGPRSVA